MLEITINNLLSQFVSTSSLLNPETKFVVFNANNRTLSNCVHKLLTTSYTLLELLIKYLKILIFVYLKCGINSDITYFMLVLD